MTREEALERFRTYSEALLQDYENKFWDNLQKKNTQLKERILESFVKLAEAIKIKGKTEIVHFQFSLLRIDLIQKKYTVLLQASDVDWYLDEATITVTLDISFLFEQLSTLEQQILSESKKYVGRVNKYDVSEIISEKVMNASKLVAHSLRFLLRDIEQNEQFAAIPKADFWVIRWGEYRDESEIILQVDRYVKSLEDWQQALKESEEKADQFICSSWYQLNLQNSELKDKVAHFIGFESSQLENVDFSNMACMGGRFRNCQLTNCSFKGAMLKYSDFRGSHFENVDFTDADLTEATFSEVDVPYLHLSPKQLQVIHIERS